MDMRHELMEANRRAATDQPNTRLLEARMSDVKRRFQQHLFVYQRANRSDAANSAASSMSHTAGAAAVGTREQRFACELAR